MDTCSGGSRKVNCLSAAAVPRLLKGNSSFAIKISLPSITWRNPLSTTPPILPAFRYAPSTWSERRISPANTSFSGESSSDVPVPGPCASALSEWADKPPSAASVPSVPWAPSIPCRPSVPWAPSESAAAPVSAPSPSSGSGASTPATPVPPETPTISALTYLSCAECHIKYPVIPASSSPNNKAAATIHPVLFIKPLLADIRLPVQSLRHWHIQWPRLPRW